MPTPMTAQQSVERLFAALEQRAKIKSEGHVLPAITDKVLWETTWIKCFLAEHMTDAIRQDLTVNELVCELIDWVEAHNITDATEDEAAA